jgi:hypothetical protein
MKRFALFALAVWLLANTARANLGPGGIFSAGNGDSFFVMCFGEGRTGNCTDFIEPNPLALLSTNLPASDPAQQRYLPPNSSAVLDALTIPDGGQASGDNTALSADLTRFGPTITDPMDPSDSGLTTTFSPPTIVPEPANAGVIAVALAALAFARKRIPMDRRRASSGGDCSVAAGR